MSGCTKADYTSCRRPLLYIIGNGRILKQYRQRSMENNAALLDTLLQQAESAAQRHGHQSRQTKQAITRKLLRTDSETVAQQLDAVYQYRPSRLPGHWRVVQQLTLYSSKKSW